MIELVGKIYKAAADFFCSAVYSVMTGTIDWQGGFMARSDSSYFMEDLLKIGTGGMALNTQFGALITSLIKNGTMALQAFGIAIDLLFCFIGIIELATENKLTPEMLVKHFSKFAAVFAVIIFTDEICFLIGNLGNLMVTAVTEIFKNNELANASISVIDSPEQAERMAMWSRVHVYNTITYSVGGRVGLGDAIPLFVSGVILLLPTLALQIGNVAVFFLALSRGLELAVRAMFMPLPVAFIAYDGWRGAGGRYVKKYAAVATQGMVIIAIARAIQIFIASAGMEFFVALKGYLEGLDCYDADVSKAAKDLGVDPSMFNGGGLAGTGSIDAFLVPFGFLETTTTIVSGALNGGKESLSVILLRLRPLLMKCSFVSVAVVFAGIGLMSKSLQICNDIWGV